MRVLFVFVINEIFVFAEYADEWSVMDFRKLMIKSSFNHTFFPSLQNYQVKARKVSEFFYPWVGRVIHSKVHDTPHICTCVCIDTGIFITAARCIYSLKVSYTTIIYHSNRLPTIAFVIPSVGTKQAFDDIGFIVVDTTNYTDTWDVIELFNETNRTDDQFYWFSKLKTTNSEFKVVGYATEKGLHKIVASDRQFNLTELDVVVDMNICSTILTFNHFIKGFYVPCYHSCSVQEFENRASKCNNYHGVEGGAVFETRTNKLLGIVTWGAYFHKYELPVGISVVNSDNFFYDYTCAQRIRSDNHLIVTAGYYQTVCDEV